ncbi:MAG: hypothetical protein ACI965_001909, partial [Paraglaciecola sp.]
SKLALAKLAWLSNTIINSKILNMHAYSWIRPQA